MTFLLLISSLSLSRLENTLCMIPLQFGEVCLAAWDMVCVGTWTMAAWAGWLSAGVGSSGLQGLFRSSLLLVFLCPSRACLMFSLVVSLIVEVSNYNRGSVSFSFQPYQFLLPVLNGHARVFVVLEINILV